MKRSDFLKLGIMAFAGSVFSTPSFASLILGGHKKIFRKVTHYYPVGKNFDDFKKERSNWMNINSSIKFLNESLQNGTVKSFECKIYPDRVEYLYCFPSQEKHDYFVSHSEKNCRLYRPARIRLGYKTEVEIS